jgi:hypothetical protein
MNRLILAALAFAIPAAADAAERRYTVTDFDRVQIEGPFVVTLATGKVGSARATGSNEAIERVSIDVQGRTLRIRPNRSAWGGYPNAGAGPLKIDLATHDLVGVAVTGSGSLALDRARAMRFDIAVSGSAQVTAGVVEADSLVLGLLGSGRIVIGGKAKTLRATIQGSGDLDAGALSVDDADLNADTAGKIGIAVRRSAKVTATGPGPVEIFGSPACTVSVLGSGPVICGR